MKRILYITSHGNRPVPALDALLELGCEPVVYVPADEHFDRPPLAYWRPWWIVPVTTAIRVADRFKQPRPSRPWPWPTLAERCAEKGIAIHPVPGNGRLGDSVGHFEALNFDLAIVNNYPFLIGKTFLDRFPGKVANFHSSELPAYRGLNQSYRILANLEPTGGVTLHCVDPGSDTGNIIAQEIFEIPAHADARTYQQLVAEGAAKILKDAWPRIESGDPGTPQPATDQPVRIIDPTTSRALRWMNRMRGKIGLAPKKV